VRRLRFLLTKAGNDHGRDGVRPTRILRDLLGVEDTVVISQSREVAEDGGWGLIVQVRPKAGQSLRCCECLRRCPRYDRRPARRWRGLDLGTTMVWLTAEVVRVSCPEHGVLTAHVPWARPGARFTRAFEDTVAWLTARTAMSVVAQFLRTTWKSVHAIVERVVTDLAGETDQLAGLKRIGIDEIAYRKGHRYLTCVVDHDTGRLVWAAEGRNSAVIGEFFDELGAERAKLLTHVSADGAEWIHTPVRERAPQAVLCLDPFHIIQWATKAVDKVRRSRWNTLRGTGHTEAASEVKGTRWAVLKNPIDLTGDQRTTLAVIAKTNHRLYRAYLLKEQLRAVFAVKGKPGRVLLAGWLAWATPLPHPRIHRAGQDNQALPAAHPQHPRPQIIQRPSRSHQHPPARPHPPSLRIPYAPSTHLHGHAHPRRTLPTAPQTILNRQTDRQKTHPPKRQKSQKEVRIWIKNWNEDPKPFAWTKTAEEILESLHKYIARISDARH
jgi:transposase